MIALSMALLFKSWLKEILGILVALAVVLVMGAPILGLHEQPWAAFWFGEQSQSVGAITFGTPVPGVPTPVPGTGGSWAAAAVAKAFTWLGVPYLWGGCSNRGIDCSCLVRNVLAAVGINAPRTTTEQIAWATPVPREQVQVGDLVFFDNTCTGCGGNPTHVGLYIGNGQMIDAGDPVQINPAFIGSYGNHNPRVGRPRS